MPVSKYLHRCIECVDNVCVNNPLFIPCSSQYGWRGSEVSVGDGVLDSGKASDLSVCSWPVEPIQWTPFPLLQQLASHRTPTVSVLSALFRPGNNMHPQWSNHKWTALRRLWGGILRSHIQRRHYKLHGFKRERLQKSVAKWLWKF